MTMQGGHKQNPWVWQWASTGAAPTNHGLDSEIFDTERVPHIQTFVREAVQNSLDARSDQTKPVCVSFRFQEDSVDDRGHFLSDLIAKKERCNLVWPDEWNAGRLSWLVVEDSNSTGLNGSLESRSKSDFWNYWLNFGISNKDGSGRGGRGIGRVTFLLASRISTVLGYTRRNEDDAIVACGMSVLRPTEDGDDFKCGYSYLAKGINKTIYDLYSGDEFQGELQTQFGLTDYATTGSTGLSLVIPYPHPEIEPAGIIAAAIEHFGPAIINQSLIVTVDDTIIDHESIEAEAKAVADRFSARGPYQAGARRVLNLATEAMSEPDFQFEITDLSIPLIDQIDKETQQKIRDQYVSDRLIRISLKLPVRRNGNTVFGEVRAAMAPTPMNVPPADCFFREGMSLPVMRASNPADIDLVVLANEGELASYLNFCEGKAHLELLETPEVKAKLIEKGFEDGVSLKRYVAKLLTNFRTLVMPDTDQPDASTFSHFFSAPSEAGNKPAKRKGKKNVIIPDPPEPKVRVFLIDELADGFRVRANPGYDKWPVTMRAEIAYADGSRRPAWSKYDFELKNMNWESSGSDGPEIWENQIRCRQCSSDFFFEISGFDIRRELVTNVKGLRDA